MWLSYSMDEVSAFHPAFKTVADEALVSLSMADTHQWLHHPKSVGIGVIPDFVLVERATHRWIVIVEIKRRPDVVDSERSQIQAKGYAEANAAAFVAARPIYFVVTNLEVTHLFSLREARPPRDCRVENMSFESGRFAKTPEAEHRRALACDLKKIVNYCREVLSPTFSIVWPQIARNAYQHADGLPFAAGMDVVAGQLPDIVRDYFSVDHELSTRREMLIRCLLVEYVRGLLRRHGHPKTNALAPVGVTLAAAANAMVQMRSVDFAGVFEQGFGAVYLSFENNHVIRTAIETYLVSLRTENVADHAATRIDSPTLTTSLIEELGNPCVRDGRGKATTDPELAGLLIAMALTSRDAVVLDPGCGEGNLLSAAYDRLTGLGLSHAQALEQLHGLEADSLAARIAALRLALKEPRLAQRNDPCHIVIGDMFGMRQMVATADVIVMNPPFKRYEAQDDVPFPPALRDHFRTAVYHIDGEVMADQGQSNLFTLYVEFVIRAAKAGATLAFILDNKWFHNEAASYLRSLLLAHCEILGVVTYPHERFFEGMMIATSMIVMRKAKPSSQHLVRFTRVEDPASTAAAAAAAAIRGGATPTGWVIRNVPQDQLNDESWKAFLTADLIHDFRCAPLAPLPALFNRGRRGSLAKEGGGIAVLEFPQGRSDYGPARSKKVGGGPFQTTKGASLTDNQNRGLRALADAIPDDYLGYAINKADRLAGYVLCADDVEQDRTIELPRQRRAPFSACYSTDRRVKWTPAMDRLVDSISALPGIGDYVSAIETEVGLDQTVLPRNQLWNALREPYAGELIIPRKMREGHRVHINPFAFQPNGRQVRLSSNFLSYGDCTAIDEESGLDAPMATHLIAAWLTSSFGHLQFEMESNNREGLRTLEQHNVDLIWVLDPRLIQGNQRPRIINAFRELPYPIRTNLRPELIPALVALDEIFAAELALIVPGLDPDGALAEVWERLHEMHDARRS